MSAEELLTQLLAKLSRPTLPVSVDLWDTEFLAAYFKLSEARVRSDIVCLPTFPKPKRPIPGGRARYVAREVIAWTEGQS